MRPISHFPGVLLITALMISVATKADSASQEDMRKWTEMRKEAIPAGELLAGDVENFAGTLVGRIKHLILNEAKNDVKYVLYETPYPYSFYAGEDGFLNYDSLDVEHSAASGINLLIEDADVTRAAEELKLTRDQVDDRMISRLIGEEMHFSDGKRREVQEMLIHPKTGKVTHFVVQMDPDTLFNEEPRTIRAKNVSVTEEGRISTDLALAEVENQQDYDPGFL